jgi:hypothetical protein
MDKQPADKEALDFIDKISSNKTKEKYKLIDDFSKLMFPVNMEPTPLSKDILSLLLDGDFNKKQIGLCHLCSGKRNVSKKLKRSSIAALELIHKFLFEHTMCKTVKQFFKSLDPDVYMAMNLGKHFLGKHNKGDNKALDLIKFIKAERPRLQIAEYILKEESYKKLEIILNEFMQDPQQQKKYSCKQ